MSNAFAVPTPRLNPRRAPPIAAPPADNMFADLAAPAAPPPAPAMADNMFADFAPPATVAPDNMFAEFSPQHQSGFVPEALKATGRGVGGIAETAMKGAAGGYGTLRQTAIHDENVASLEMLDRIERGELAQPWNPGNRSLGLPGDRAEQYRLMTPEERAAERGRLEADIASFVPTDVKETDIYKSADILNEDIQKFIPAAPGWEDSVTSTVFTGLGSVLGGVGAYAVGGPLAAGALFTAAGAGDQLERFLAWDAAEKAAGRPGGTPEQQATATIAGASIGTLDLLPLETALGVLKVPMPFRKPIARLIGRIGGQAALEGGQEGFSQLLQNVAEGGYDPSQDTTEGVVPNVAAGVGVGGIVQAIVEAATKGRGAGAQPQRDQPPAEAAPSEPYTPPADQTPLEMENARRREAGLPELPAAPVTQPAATPAPVAPVLEEVEEEPVRDIAELPPDEVGVLRGAGWSDDAITDMADEERVAAAEEARTQGAVASPAPRPVAPAPAAAPVVAGRPEFPGALTEPYRSPVAGRPEVPGALTAPYRSPIAGRPEVSGALTEPYLSPVTGRPETPGALTEPYRSPIAGRSEVPGALPAAPLQSRVAGRPEFPGVLPAAPFQSPIAGRPEMPGALPAAPELNAPASEAAPARSSGIEMVDPRSLKVAPERFQFRENTDVEGLAPTLKGVQKWHPERGNQLIVWEDKAGNRYVVDGHQRVGLAKRLMAEGKETDIQIPAVVFREADGVTDIEAMELASLKNIAEGSASPIEAAKVLRASGKEALADLPMPKEAVRSAVDLSKLNDEAFRMVVNGVVEPNHAKYVGRFLAGDKDRQIAAMKALSRAEVANEDEAAVLVRRVVAAELAKDESGAQVDMFGSTPDSTALEEVRIVAGAMRQLRRDKTLFAKVAAEADRIEKTGSRIERKAAEQTAEDADRLSSGLDTIAFRAGPIRDKLRTLAGEVKNESRSLSDARTAFVESLRSGEKKPDAARGRPREPEPSDQAGSEQRQSGRGRKKPPDTLASSAVEPDDGPFVIRREKTGGVVGTAKTQEEAVGLVNDLPYPPYTITNKNGEVVGQKPTTEPGADNQPQTVLPGAERLSEAEVARRKADAALAARQAQSKIAPKKPQKGADEGGLFGDERKQLKLFSSIPTAPPFYSALLRAAEAVTLKRASADQWLATFRNTPGVKQEELDWIGLSDWLKVQTGPITKEAVTDFIRANRIEVRDVMHGEPTPVDRIVEEDGLWVAYDDQNHVLGAGVSRAEAEQEARPSTRMGERPTKHGGYQLPGGENYRELLLTLPVDSRESMRIGNEIADANRSLREKYGERWRDQAPREALPEIHRLEKLESELHRLSEGDQKGAFRTSHFDEPNVLAHVRFNDRVDANGRKTLFIEEIQSDWHQAGRKTGYKTKDADRIAAGRQEAFEAYRRELQAKYGQAFWGRQTREETLKYDELNTDTTTPKGVPDAPFKTTWPELALKRMIRWAAENGYDQVAWTPGVEQVKRYANAMRQQVLSIKWEDRSFDESGRLRTIDIVPTRGEPFSIFIDKRGVITYGLDGALGKPLEDLVGKDIATRILSEPSGKVEGNNLTIGGKGMTEFYDRILVNVGNKLGKRFGAKVGTARITTEPGQTVPVGESESGGYRPIQRATVHVLPITPEMRSAALAGQPLFRRDTERPRQALRPVERRALENELRSIIGRVAGLRVEARFPDLMDIREFIESDEIKELERAARASGNRLVRTIGGSWTRGTLDALALIRVSLADPNFDPTTTAFHEAWHHVQMVLLTDAELRVLEAEMPRLRAFAALEVNAAGTAIDVRNLPDYEIVAIAFQRYARMKKAGEDIGGISVAVRRMFEKIMEVLRQVRATLKGRKITRYEDLFGRAYRGDFGNRAEGTEAIERAFAVPDVAFASIPNTMPMPGSALQDRAEHLAGWKARTGESTRVKLQDRFLRIQRFQEAIEKQLGFKLGTPIDVYQAIRLYTGKGGEAIKDLKTDHFIPLEEDMRTRKVEEEELADYLYARHAPERNAEMAKINPDVGQDGSGMSNAEAAGIINRITNAGRLADFQTLAVRVDAIQAFTRSTLVKAGLIDPKTAFAWKQKYPNYVPLRGFDDPAAHTDEYGVGQPKTGKGFDVRGPESKQAFGRRSKADSPLAYVYQQAMQAIVRAEKNRALKTLLRFALDPVVAKSGVFKVDKAEMSRRINPTTGMVETYAKPPQHHKQENLFAVKIGGKTHWIQVDNPGYTRALRGIGSGVDSALGSALLRISHTYAKLLTQWNPDFLVPNFVRDLQTALINVSEFTSLAKGVRRKILKDAFLLTSVRGAMAAMYDLKTTNKMKGYFDEFRRAGGMTSMIELNDIATIKRKIERAIGKSQMRRALGTAGELIGNLNTAVENGVRLSVYVHLRESGVEQDRAAFIARDLTTDFNLRGEWGQALNAAYIFYNASIQGSFRLARAVRRSRTARVAVAAIFAHGFAMEFLNAFLSGGDDDDLDYDKIEDWERQRNMIIMLPGGGNQKIPLPYGYNVPYIAGQQLAALLRGKRNVGEAVSNVGAATLDSFNPLGMFVSTLQFASPWFLDPVAQSAENKNFAGSPIMPRIYGDTKPLSETYWKSAPSWAKWMARELNSFSGGNVGRPGAVDVSPETLQHFAEFAGGGVGKFLVRAITTTDRALRGEEWLPEDTPILNRFYSDPDTGAAIERQYFDTKAEVDQAHDEQRVLDEARDRKGAREARDTYRPEIRAYEAFNNVEAQRKDIRELRDRAERIEDPDRRRKELDRLEEREKKAMQRALDAYSRAKGN